MDPHCCERVGEAVSILCRPAQWAFIPVLPPRYLIYAPPASSRSRLPDTVSSNTRRRPQQDCNASAAEVRHQPDVTRVLSQGVKCRRLGCDFCNFAKARWRDGSRNGAAERRSNSRTVLILSKLHPICGKISARQKRSNGTSRAKDFGRGRL